MKYLVCALLFICILLFAFCAGCRKDRVDPAKDGKAASADTRVEQPVVPPEELKPNE
jgi:hypothetical protein